MSTRWSGRRGRRRIRSGAASYLADLLPKVDIGTSMWQAEGTGESRSSRKARRAYTAVGGEERIRPPHQKNPRRRGVAWGNRTARPAAWAPWVTMPRNPGEGARPRSRLRSHPPTPPRQGPIRESHGKAPPQKERTGSLKASSRAALGHAPPVSATRKGNDLAVDPVGPDDRRSRGRPRRTNCPAGVASLLGRAAKGRSCVSSTMNPVLARNWPTMSRLSKKLVVPHTDAMAGVDPDLASPALLEQCLPLHAAV